MKEGWRTSEFWMTLLMHVLTVLVAGNVLAPGSQWAKVAALALSALAQYGYTTARASVKTGSTGASTSEASTTVNVAPVAGPPASPK